MPHPRIGPFWDMIEGRVPPPPVADLLGWRLLAIDPDAGTIEVSFDADERFLNPNRTIQGGILVSMLDDTLGPAFVATLGPDEFAPTIDIQTQFHRPARPGTLVGHGRVVRRGRDIGFLAGELLDDDGTVIATATAAAIVRRFGQVDSATSDL